MHKLFEKSFPIIKIDSEYTLREQHETDATDFLAYYSDPAVSEHILAEIPQNIEQSIAEIRYCRHLFYQKNGIYWAISSQTKDQMVGAIGVYIRSDTLAEICYDLDKHYWQQKIMTRALNTTINFIFSHSQLETLYALTLAENTASIRLLQKSAFHHEQTLKQHRFHQGRYHDVEKYVRTRQ